LTQDFLPHNFLGLPKEYSDFSKAEFLIFPVPYEQTTTYQKGTSFGPQAIIQASQQVEFFDVELGKESYKKGVHTLDELFPTSAGPKEMVEKIHNLGKKLIGSKKKIIMLGGEHIISLGMVQVFKEKYKNLSVLQLDAHADLRDSYQESKFNHACVMRRIKEICPTVQVGIRNLSLEENNFIRKDKSKIFFAEKIRNKKDWQKEAISSLSENVYLTLDLDFFDPSIMPSVGTPEPGGFLWYETLEFLKEVFAKKNMVGCDVVELCPQPGNIAPDFTVAKLVYKIMGYWSA
jgi:agmatinase